jgi:hypothetical protein
VYCAASTPWRFSSDRHSRARGQRIGIEHIVVARLERGARQRRRAPGAALVDQHHVARAPQFGEARGEGREMRRRLSRSAGEYDQRIVLRIDRVGRKHGGEDSILRPAGRLRSSGTSSTPHCAAVGRFSKRHSLSVIVRWRATSLPHPLTNSAAASAATTMVRGEIGIVADGSKRPEHLVGRAKG